MEVAIEFDVSLTVALLGVSLYVLGLAFGSVLAVPISETLGRLAVYRLSIPLTAACTLGAGFSQNMASLAICRFFAGFFGSPCLVIGAGSIADLWPHVTRATAISLHLLATFLGLALGPTVGGFTTQHRGWRWTQWAILMALAMCGLAVLAMKETYLKVIEEKKAKAHNNGSAKPSNPSGVAALNTIATVTLIRPVCMLFTEPIVGFLSIHSGFHFAILYGCKYSFYDLKLRTLRIQCLGERNRELKANSEC